MHVVKALRDFFLTVQDLRNGTKDIIHADRHCLYCDSALNREEILPHVMSSERGMPVERIMGIDEQYGELLVHVL